MASILYVYILLFSLDYHITQTSGCHSLLHRWKRASDNEILGTTGLRDFFIQCVSQRAENVLDSYVSAVDLTILDTKWFENSDNMFCGGSAENDSVSCWVERIQSYILETSPLYNATMQCIDDYSVFILESDRECTITGWTPFFNRYNITDSVDLEQFNLLQQDFPGRICDRPNAIDARTLNGVDYTEFDIPIEVGPTTGLLCNNTDNSEDCPNFKVRFCCPNYTPARCSEDEWTDYFDNDNPNGNGDFEIPDALRNRFPGQICDFPSSIMAILVNDSVVTTDYRDTGENVSISIDGGFICRNDDQLDGSCLDYKVRFCCPTVRDASHPWHVANQKRKRGVNQEEEYEQCYDEEVDLNPARNELRIPEIIDFLDNHVICTNNLDCNIDENNNTTVTNASSLTQFWPFKLQGLLRDDSRVITVVETCNTEVFSSGWTPWSTWSECGDLQCGSGTIQSQTRNRLCIGGGNCVGTDTEHRCCGAAGGNTGVWGSWGEFGECVDDVRTRRRICSGSSNCQGSDTETRACLSCPSDENTSGFSQWSDFDPCNAPCGQTSTTVRRRHCTTGPPDSEFCKGAIEEKWACTSMQCGTWSEWSEFSECGTPQSCGNAKMTRTRTCINGEVGQPNCNGLAVERVTCKTGRPCPNGWGEWYSWGNCPTRCGETGSQLRRRQCFGGVPGQSLCPGDLQESRSCAPSNCPFWATWSTFGACSVTCGVGQQIRRRICINGNPGDFGCQGRNVERRFCTLIPCSSDGDTSGFSQWSTFDRCNMQCGQTSTQTRRRHCNTGQIGSPRCRGPAVETQTCPTIACGRWTVWSAFSPCGGPSDCGHSNKMRTRSCEGGVVGARDCFGRSVETQQCYTGRSCRG